MQHQGQRCECMRSPAGILLLECQSRSSMVVALSAAPAMIPRERRRSLVADMRPCASGGRIVRTLGRSQGPAAHRPLQATEIHLTDTCDSQRGSYAAGRSDKPARYASVAG